MIYNSLIEYLGTKNGLSDGMNERVALLDAQKQAQAVQANVYENSPLSNELYTSKKMNADELSDYILDKQSKFNASKPFFADDNEVARKNQQFMKELGFHVRNSGQGHLVQDDDGSLWVEDSSGKYARILGSTAGNLYRSFRDNVGSVGGSVVGAVGGGMVGGVPGMVVGSALGASLGAGYDYYANTKDTNQETDLKEALMLAGENAGLSLIGDAAFAAGAKGIRALKNGYNLAKTGSQAGKDMIDGMVAGGSHLKENVGDKLRKISPSIVNDLASQGVETSRAYAKELIKSAKGDYDAMLQSARAMPLEVNQGNVFVDLAANKAQGFSDNAKINFVKNTAGNTADFLKNISKNIGSKEAALNQQDLINLSLMNDDLANMARAILAKDPKLANKVANSLSAQDEALLKELNLNHSFKADELYTLRETRAKRAYDEFERGLEDLDKLNPRGVLIDKQALDDIVDNSGIYTEGTPPIIKGFINEARSGVLDGKSVKEIHDRISVISKKLEKENLSHNYNGFLNNLKDELLESIVRSSDNPRLARETLNKIRKDYADFKLYDKSKLGRKLEGSEAEITKDIDKILNETHSKKNYEAITKGLNDNEVKVLDNQIILRALDKHKINIGDKTNPKLVINHKALMENLENFKPRSQAGQEQMEVLKTIGNIRSSLETIVDGILNTKAKELGHGIATHVFERVKTMLVNILTDYVAFYFMRLLEVGKRAGTRIQMRRGFSNINNLQDFDKSARDFISSIKDRALREEANKARSEFNTRVKDLIEGDNFFMDKPNPKKARSDFNVELSLNDNVKKNLNIDVSTLKANLHTLKKKHPEFFKTNASVARVIKEIKDNPNRYYKNDRLDISLVAKDLKDGKIGKMGIVNQGENVGKVGHLSVSSKKEKELERLEYKNKESLGVGSPTPTLRSTENQGGQKAGAKAHSLNSVHSTQTTPKESLKTNEDSTNPYLKHYRDFMDRKEAKKESLIQRLNENIKAKEEASKETKSVKQRIDEDMEAKYSNEIKELEKKIGDLSLSHKLAPKDTEIIQKLENLQNKKNELLIKKDNLFKSSADKLLSEVEIGDFRVGKYVVNNQVPHLLRDKQILIKVLDDYLNKIKDYEQKLNDTPKLYDDLWHNKHKRTNDFLNLKNDRNKTLSDEASVRTDYDNYKSYHGYILDRSFEIEILKVVRNSSLQGLNKNLQEFFTQSEKNYTKILDKTKKAYKEEFLKTPEEVKEALEVLKDFKVKSGGMEISLKDEIGVLLENIKIDQDSISNTSSKTRIKSLKDSIRSYLGEANHILSYLKSLQKDKQELEPFGTNYEQFYHKGKEAIKHLLEQRQGQVKGAFYREDLGDIDLVWGEARADKKGYGLAHILDKHGDEFADLANDLNEVIFKGVLIKDGDRATIQKDNLKVGLKSNWEGKPTKNRWVVTAYYDTRETPKTINSRGFTEGETHPSNSLPHSSIKESQKQEKKDLMETLRENIQAKKSRKMGIDELIKKK